ncbi:hypothetical protein MTBLM1_60248 [Rhodospirillaceae bacterium LM-1]|nr:hypothetical protein MTBLM1_60248 [Rhodospirillaceae bacterium LM-1]
MASSGGGTLFGRYRRDGIFQRRQATQPHAKRWRGPHGLKQAAGFLIASAVKPARGREFPALFFTQCQRFQSVALKTRKRKCIKLQINANQFFQ